MCNPKIDRLLFIFPGQPNTNPKISTQPQKMYPGLQKCVQGLQKCNYLGFDLYKESIKNDKKAA